MSEANKALIRQLVEEIQNQHNGDAFDEFFAPSFVNYDPLPGLPGTLEGAKQLHRMLFAAFPDLRMTIHDQAAEGDKVWTRKTATGTHRGEFFGIPATGKQVSWKIIDIMSIRDRKVTEHWVVADVMSLTQQLGAVPQ
ncbi:MAG TPA: ester cyclase [Candidatus Binatia bacterium]|jgi:predicted ester cyclase|nr:ester cyclase [Candidatus Binatia bacterium]